VNLRPKRRQEPEVNLIPLIDILLVLILFFSVSTSFYKASNLKIDLPEASVQPNITNERQPLEVVIDAEGRYFINGHALADSDPETLKAALARWVDQHERTFIIRADARTPYQAVVTAMDVAGQLGFRHLALPTVQPTGRSEPETNGPEGNK